MEHRCWLLNFLPYQDHKLLVDTVQQLKVVQFGPFPGRKHAWFDFLQERPF